MMTLDAHGNFDPWCQPEYGHDAQDRPVVPPPGFVLIPKGEPLQKGDLNFDVYSGWFCSGPNLRYQSYAVSSGRWTAWARKEGR